MQYIKTRYSIEPRDQIFVTGDAFLSFTKIKGKNISKTLSGKNSHNLFDHAKQFAADALKATSKILIQKTAKATSALVGNITAYEIIRTTLRNASETALQIDDKTIDLPK